MTVEPAEFTQRVAPIVRARKNFSKLFCIGYNKTGTTTMEALLRLYGYRLPNQQFQEIELTRQTFRGNYEPLKEFVPNYDAFQDLPFSNGHTYIVADALFSGSKFILTERDPDEWFDSMCRFHQKRTGISDLSSLTESDINRYFTYLYPGYQYDNKVRALTRFKGDTPETRWDLLYNRDHYIDFYTRRNEEIKKYFMYRPSDLLVIDPTKESTTEKLCRFLDLPDDLIISMPHQNKT